MEPNIFHESGRVNELNEKFNSVRTEIAKVIVGQEEVVDLVLIGILSDGHILIEGVPGVAKTLLAKLVSRILDVQFSRLQFTPDLMPGDVIGTSVFNPREGNFNFKPGPVFSNLVLIDEINRAPAKTQSALFEVMEERQVTIDGQSHAMQFPFIVIATQNPIEQEGTYRLPEAQLDRFIFKINIEYPDLKEEMNILERQQGRAQNQLLQEVNVLLNASAIANYREIVRDIRIERNLLEYIALIVHSTRNNAALYLGASTRASLAILKASKAKAALNGRDFVTPEDIQYIAPHVLSHRIILTPEKEMEGLTAQMLVKDMISSVEVPR